MKVTRWIGGLVLVAWCLTGGAVAASEDKPSRAEGKAAAKSEHSSEGKVNINVASKDELMKLDGVGAGTAQKIIAYRETHGPFKRAHDLEKVEGVGKVILEKNAGRIAVK